MKKFYITTLFTALMGWGMTTQASTPQSSCLDEACGAVFISPERVAAAHAWNEAHMKEVCLGAEWKAGKNTPEVLCATKAPGLKIAPSATALRKDVFDMVASVTFEDQNDDTAPRELIAEIAPVRCRSAGSSAQEVGLRH